MVRLLRSCASCTFTTFCSSRPTSFRMAIVLSLSQLKSHSMLHTPGFRSSLQVGNESVRGFDKEEVQTLYPNQIPEEWGVVSEEIPELREDGRDEEERVLRGVPLQA